MFNTVANVTAENVEQALASHGQSLQAMQDDVSALFWVCSNQHPEQADMTPETRTATVKTVLAFAEKQHGINVSKIDVFMRLAVSGKLSISKGKITCKKSGKTAHQRSYAGIMERFSPTEKQCSLLWNPPKSDDSDDSGKNYTVDEIVASMLKRFEKMAETAGELTPAEVAVAVKAKLADELAKVVPDSDDTESE